jgi:uncharacterized protein YceK
MRFVAMMVALGLAGCASTRSGNEAQTAASQLDSMTRTADRIAEDIKQRWAVGDTVKSAPLVIRMAVNASAYERAVAELTATSYLAKGGSVAVQCGERCLELSISDMGSVSISDEQGAALSAGDLVQVASSANPLLGSITRHLTTSNKSPALETLLVQVSLREQQRYLQRHHFITPMSVPSATDNSAPHSKSGS